MPFATVISPDPLSAIASCAPTPLPEDEFTSMLMGEPVEVVKCETSDLYVPAHAEIIIEGVMLPNVMIEEAPFGEYTGYRTSPREKRTVYRVKAITMRKKPIMAVSNMGVPTDEGQLLRSFSLGLEMEKLLRDQGIPITGVYMLPESTHHLVVVGVKPIYANIATQIAQLVFGSKLGPWFHMVIVVDDKTDIYNKDEIIHALCTSATRSRASRHDDTAWARRSIPTHGRRSGSSAGRQGRLRLPLPAGLAGVRRCPSRSLSTTSIPRRFRRRYSPSGANTGSRIRRHLWLYMILI